MELSERLQELRKANNYSQEDIAEKLDVSRQAVSKWESGQGKPEINNIIKLAEIYDVTTDFLLMGKESNVTYVENNLQTERNEANKKTMSRVTIIVTVAVVLVFIIVVSALVAKFLPQ